jgi:hypothetical protein
MSDENTKTTRNPWPGYPRRFALGPARIVEVTFEDAPRTLDGERDGGAPYVLAVDAEHESVELRVDHAAPAGYLTVKERELVDALGDVLQLGRRASFAVDVRRAVAELHALQRDFARLLVQPSDAGVAAVLNHVDDALRALGEVPRG